VELYRFDPAIAHRVEQFGSSFLHQFLTVASGARTRVSIMHLGAGDRVGYHQAVTDQLFAVVAGDGFVQDEARQDVAIRAGQAAFWLAGESHGAHTPSGLTAVVVEGTGLHPEKFMPALRAT
jgi:mannose-6-phosphate isomerase-like protein (cupin superfamily)